MPRTKKDFVNQKRKITTEIEAFFMKKGYENTSLDDILNTLKLSKGRFYHYFASKEEVILESMHMLSDQLLIEVEKILIDDQLNAIDKLLKFIPIRNSAYKEKSEILNYFQMICSNDIQKYQFLKILGQEYVSPLASVIQEGIEEGIFQVEHPYETAELLLSAILSIPNLFVISDHQEDNIKRKKYDEAIEMIVIRTLGIKLERLR